MAARKSRHRKDENKLIQNARKRAGLPPEGISWPYILSLIENKGADNDDMCRQLISEKQHHIIDLILCLDDERRGLFGISDKVRPWIDNMDEARERIKETMESFFKKDHPNSDDWLMLLAKKHNPSFEHKDTFLEKRSKILEILHHMLIDRYSPPLEDFYQLYLHALTIIGFFEFAKEHPGKIALDVFLKMDLCVLKIHTVFDNLLKKSFPAANHFFEKTQNKEIRDKKRFEIKENRQKRVWSIYKELSAKRSWKGGYISDKGKAADILERLDDERFFKKPPSENGEKAVSWAESTVRGDLRKGRALGIID